VIALRSRLAKVEATLAGRSSTRHDLLDRYRTDPPAVMTDAGLAPDPWQGDLLRADAGKALLLCARQVGKSTACAYLALRTALLTPGITCLIVSPSLRQSGEMLRKVSGGLAALGRPVGVANESASALALANGARVLSLPGSEATVRGFSAGLLIVDEAARVPDGLLAGVRPMLAATGGRFVALSSAFAASGWFYDLWTAGGPGWLRLSVTADACPRISPAFLAEERAILGPRWFAMEYMNEFQDDVAAVFSGDDIRAAVSADVAPLFGGAGP
jgi:hypothetical protein